MSVDQIIDSIADRFRNAWGTSESPPALSAFIPEGHGPECAGLVFALLCVDAHERLRRNMPCSPGCYAGVDSDYADIIQDFLAATSDSQTAPSNPDAPGRISDYELVGVLGRGGMGRVYLAKKKGLQKRVAVKTLLRIADRNSDLRFIREANYQSMLQHPNIVAVWDIGQMTHGRYFLVMDYAPGVTLDAYLRSSGLLSIERTLSLFSQIVSAASAAHSNNIVHRDLKPQNVIVALDGSVRVTDFGLAKFMGPDRPTDLTVPGVLVGTFRYMAPEQACGQVESITFSTDVHALGAILYEMLTGHSPYVGTTPELLAAICSESLPPNPCLVRADVPVPLGNLCMKCIAKAPIERFTSAIELEDELLKLYPMTPECYRAPTARTIANPLPAPLAGPNRNYLDGIRAEAEAGYVVAMYTYALTCKDPRDRLHWLTRAAKRGYPPALRQLEHARPEDDAR